MGPDPTFPEGFGFVGLAGTTISGALIELREDERDLGTPLWSPEEGRLDHGVLKRYTPINRARGSASTARFPDVPREFTLLAALLTSQDGDNLVETMAAAAIDDGAKMGIEGLRNEQEEATRDSRRELPASATMGGGVLVEAPGTVAPRLRKRAGYYGDIPLCSVSTTKFCYQDASLWHGDFHLNEIRAEPMLTLGLYQELLPYCEMILALLLQAREYARDVYSLPGAMYPLVHFPIRCQGNCPLKPDMGARPEPGRVGVEAPVALLPVHGGCQLPPGRGLPGPEGMRQIHSRLPDGGA
jgi:hypothetical protein